MPAPTTAINGCDAVIFLEDESLVLQDISGDGNSFELELSNEIGQYKTFGQTWPKRLACGKDASLSLDVVYRMEASGENPAALGMLRDWFFNGGDSRLIKLCLPDNSSGNDSYYGYFVLETLTIPAAADEADPIMVSAEFLPNGDVTYEVIP